jgi:hypothetical protein
VRYSGIFCIGDWVADNCGKIARQGCTVIVPFREEMAKRHLKVAGDLGRVIFMVWERIDSGPASAYILSGI